LALSTGSPTGAVPCGIDVQYIKYGTVGGKDEATTATAALMVPTGTDPACTGARPIILHAHGTAVEQRYNMADFTDSTNPAYSESQVLAAIYAAQGYIVVAPNYAGYDASTLGYHPFLVASQQSKDMLDALVAAKAALPTLIAGTTTNGKVFLSGYSQGGHVALATHRAMITDPATVAKLASLSLTVKASAPMSGPYALKAFGDQIVGGAVNASSTVLLPMLITGYQKTYGGLYSATSDLYENSFATGIESLFPGALSYTNLIATGKVPAAALFDTASLPAAPAGPLNALWSAGFGTPNLIKSAYRTAYLGDTLNATPTNALRTGLKANDLTTMATPVGATMLCAGSNDPTVYYATNTGAMTTLWTPYLATPSAPTNPVTVVNMDLGATTANPADPFGSLKTSFTAKNPTTAAAYASTYHANLLPYCVRAARGFFALVP
jgi:predicted esterase